MKIILAGTYEQYMDWCRIHEESPRNCLYLDDPIKLMGLYFSENDVRRVGTYYSLKNIYEIECEIAYRMVKNERKVR